MTARVLWSVLGHPYPEGRDTVRASLDLDDAGELILTLSDADDTEQTIHLTRDDAGRLWAAIHEELRR